MKDIKPLDGILVIALEQAVAAPLCTSRLADAGARVIKIEREEGDFARGYDAVVNGESSYFVWTNHGKESVVLDIKSARDKQLLDAMLEKADVFIQNLAPGAARRAGFGSDDLRRRFPRLITCNISGYGEGSAYQDMKAYDLLIQSESGLVSVSGGPESYGRIGVSLCDIAAGMNALVGIQQALLKREKTGQGSKINVSLFDGAVDWMSVPILQQKYSGKGPQRSGLKHPSIAPYGEFKTADEKIIVIAIQNEREWFNFCSQILDDSSLANDPKYNSNRQRVINRDELEVKIGSVFASFTACEMSEKLRQASVAYGSLNTTEDLVNHPLVRYLPVDTEHGQAQIVAPAIIVDDETPSLGSVPAIGEHTEQIFAEFGRDD